MGIRSFLCTLTLGFSVCACKGELAPDSHIEVAVKGLHSGAISDDAALLIAGSIYHGGSLWRLADKERIFNWNHDSQAPSTIIAADFSDDNRWALTAMSHTLVLWNTQSGQSERFWTAPAGIRDVELNKDASLALLALDDNRAVIFNARRGGIRSTLQHKNRVLSVDFSEDARFAITGSEDETAILWDLRNAQALRTIKHDAPVQLVALSNDGQLALSASKYDKALVWRTENAEKITEIPLSAERLKRGLVFSSARFNKDNSRLLTGRPDQIVQLWQLAPLRELARWQLPKRQRWKPSSVAVIDVAFQDDAHFVAAGSNGWVYSLSLPAATISSSD